MKYSVIVDKLTWEDATVIVEADNKKMAKDKAIDQAKKDDSELSWNQYDEAFYTNEPEEIE